VGSGAWSLRLWAPSGGAGAALRGAVRALSAAPLGVPGRALRLRRPGGYQARLRRPGNAVPSKITHPLNIIDFTTAAADTACAAAAATAAAARRATDGRCLCCGARATSLRLPHPAPRSASPLTARSRCPPAVGTTAPRQTLARARYRHQLLCCARPPPSSAQPPPAWKTSRAARPRPREGHPGTGALGWRQQQCCRRLQLATRRLAGGRPPGRAGGSHSGDAARRARRPPPSRQATLWPVATCAREGHPGGPHVYRAAVTGGPHVYRAAETPDERRNTM